MILVSQLQAKSLQNAKASVLFKISTYILAAGQLFPFSLIKTHI